MSSFEARKLTVFVGLTMSLLFDYGEKSGITVMSKLLILTFYYVIIFSFTVWLWSDADDSTKTGLFYFVFGIAFFQNAYHTHKIETLKNKKEP